MGDHRTLEYPLRSRPNQIQNQSHSPPCLLPTTPLRNPPLANPSSTPPPLTCSPASPPSLATSLTKRRPSKLTTRPALSLSHLLAPSPRTARSELRANGTRLWARSRKQQAREQNLQGQGQEAKGQLSDLGQGISDRVQGTLGGAVAGLTNDRESQQKYADIHDEGKSRQRGVEADLDKMAAAQEKQQQQAHK